jgi:chaperonin GroEL (HSP60 family)
VSIFLEKEILESFNIIQNDLRKFLNIEKVLFLEKDNILLKTSFQGIFNLKYSNSLLTTIHRLIIEHCILSEKISPGGFDLTLNQIVLGNLNSLKKASSHASEKDLKNLIFSQTKDETLSNILFESILLSGFGGRISVEKSNNDITSIEVIDGFTFKVKTFEEKSLKIIRPKVLVIDGYIESVSEINLLLESVYSSKYPLVLITRGYHDDVLNTIKVNKARGTIEVYPIVVEFNLEGINKLNDISIASSSSLVTSNLGQLISNVTIDDASFVEEISIYHNSICIRNSASNSHVNSHIKFLLNKREELKNVEEVYEERIRSLSSNNVIIRLPDSKDFVVKRQSVDYCLRSIKSMIEFGVTDNSELYGSYIASQKYSEIFFKKLNSIGAILHSFT